MTSLQPFDVITPLGPAICVGICDETEITQWVTFIRSTGECWFWTNPFIRYYFDTTSNGGNVSPFENISIKIENQIKRYKKNGWLK